MTENEKKSKQKQHEEKDKFHISWKNHNVEKYIKESLKEYLKIQEKRK